MPSATAVTTAPWGLPLGAALAVLALTATGPEPRALPALYLAVVTPALAAADVRDRRLPNALTLPGYAAAAIGIAGQWILSGGAPATALIAGPAYGLALLLLAAVGGMGMGDVKLAGVLGFASGLVGAEAAVVAPLAAFLLGGVAAVGALRGGRSRSVPFGPYLLAGFWIALLISPGGSST